MSGTALSVLTFFGAGLGLALGVAALVMAQRARRQTAVFDYSRPNAAGSAATAPGASRLADEDFKEQMRFADLMEHTQRVIHYATVVLNSGDGRKELAAAIGRCEQYLVATGQIGTRWTLLG